jgi:aminopeptidase
MNKEILEKYAKLLLVVGLGFKDGQCLEIFGEPEHMDIIDELEEQAYKMGAPFVLINVTSPRSSVNYTNYRKNKYLGYLPKYSVTERDEKIKEHWARIYFCDTQDNKVLAEVDSKKALKLSKALKDFKKPMGDAVNVFMQVPHTIALYPTKKWAATLLNKEPNDKTLKEAWEVLIPILKLDQPDPVKAWKDVMKKRDKQAKILTDFKPETIHFKSRNTDLFIGINYNAHWGSAYEAAFDGRKMLVNIPSDEIFTTPNCNKTEGYVTITKPVDVLGKPVVGAVFEFERGKIVHYKADQNEKQLDLLFKADPRSRYLGEVALVDFFSEINQTNLIFNEILIDENASCHIALGDGYPSMLHDIDISKKKILEQNGCNIADHHIDFMIGAKDMDVTILKESKLYPGSTDIKRIMLNGRILI